MNINKCTDNPALGIYTDGNVPYLVRRRGSCTNIAGGLLTGGTRGVYITCRKVRHFFPTSGVVVAKGPMHRGMLRAALAGRRTQGRFNLSPSGGAVLLINKDLNTEAVGRDILRRLSLIGRDNIRFV